MPITSPENLNSVPESYMMEIDIFMLFFELYTYGVAYTHVAHTYK